MLASVITKEVVMFSCLLILIICFYLEKKEFLMVTDLLNVKVIEVTDQITFLERFIPRIYNSYVSVRIRFAVCHK